MMNLIDVKSEDTVGININGEIKDKDFDAVTSLLKEKIDKHGEVNIYMEMENMGKISPQTILKDLRFGIKYLDNIRKEAIVTEKGWLNKLTPVADKIFSDVEIQTFSFSERDQAKNWVKN